MSTSDHDAEKNTCSTCGASATCGHTDSHAAGAEHFEEALLRATLNQIGRKLLVMSGKGGVGKSSVAVSLALTLARQGQQVGLMDVDLHGPNVLRMLGLSGPLNVEERQLFYTPPGVANLKVVSIEAFMPDRESAVIWRGPLKHSAIRQFISDIDWGRLDYLVIDAPPGTGDEPLSVVQTIPEVEAVIVTTPQEISLADVRKSIDFCWKTNIRIVGLLENMGRLICPDCGKEIPLFSSGGGQRLATLTKVPYLGSLPFDPKVLESADAGQLSLLQPEDSPFLQHLAAVAQTIAAATPLQAAAGVS
ncbi:MAG: P-loop NTPase [Desulfobacca sp.]|uniref:P-loop NTPase n=1 Tax=Desulfobacca sp. TaxID=2067990 RepID=UPI00404B2E2B